MLTAMMPHAVIELAFDPIVRIGDWSVRWETLALGAVLFVTLVVAALVARSTAVDPTRPADAPFADVPTELNRLRADDLLYVAVAALPGAVVGGRLGYYLLHREFYDANPGLLLDVTQGGLELSLGVAGGVLSASIVGAMLGAPLGRWLHALTLPVLLALAGGKAAMILGGTGQGAPTDESWATAYLGPGPWGSLAPAIPSHPSQAYEAVATLVVALLVLWVLAFGAFPGRRGGAFLFGIGLWGIARAIVATTWRDPLAVGGLGMGQVLALGVATAAFGLMGLVGLAGIVAGRRARAAPAAAAPGMIAGVGGPGSEPVPGRLPDGIPATAAPEAAPQRRRAPGEPEWPDPSSRPRI